MEDQIDFVMKVGSENREVTVSKGELKVKKTPPIKTTKNIDLAEIIDKYIMPKLGMIGLKDLSILINGLVIIFYRQQVIAYSEIQGIYNELVCPTSKNTEESKPSKEHRPNNNPKSRRKMNEDSMQFLTNLSQLLTRRHYLMFEQEMSTMSVTNSCRKKRMSDRSHTDKELSMMISNQQQMLDNEIPYNHDMDIFNEFNDHMTFSITQGLQALKQQLSFDINDVIRRQHERGNEEGNICFEFCA